MEVVAGGAETEVKGIMRRGRERACKSTCPARTRSSGYTTVSGITVMRSPSPEANGSLADTRCSGPGGQAYPADPVLAARQPGGTPHGPGGRSACNPLHPTRPRTTARREPRMTAMRARGFTLIELMVALFITAIVFAMGYGAVNQALNSRQSLEDRQARLLAVQTTMRVLAQDFDQRSRARCVIRLGRPGCRSSSVGRARSRTSLSRAAAGPILLACSARRCSA